MSGVPNQGHFYCSAAPVGSAWIIYERRNKKASIDGHFSYRCSSRYYAYKLANVLNSLYSLGALVPLQRFREFVRDCPNYSFDYFYACGLLDSLIGSRDDSEVMSAPIVSNGV